MRKILLPFLLILFFSSLLFGALEDEVLMPDQAFKPSAVLKDGKIVVEIKLGDKIYAYKDKLHFTITSPKTLSLDKDLKLPKPVKYHEFIVYFDKVKQSIPLSLIKKKLGQDVQKIKLKVNFQGCSKLGLCYSPMKKEFTFNLKNINKTVSASTAVAATAKTKKITKWNLSKENNTKADNKQVSSATKKPLPAKTNIVQTKSEESSIADTLAKSSFIMVLVTFFGFGLLLSLTPCVFPMIPILSSIIVSQSKDGMNAKKGFILSLVYVLSMSVAYTIAGVLAGLFGANIQILLQNTWVIVIFSAIFVALAFSMFGYYELQLPASLQSKINSTSDKAQGKGLVSVAVMGFLSALIVGPCVAAPLAGALIYIGQTGDAFLGGTALFIMSIGMGVPLLLIGIGAGKFMPKPGGWMQNVSKIFGVVMLAVAIYLISRVIPDIYTMLLWAFLLIGSAVYLGALEPLKDGVSGIAKMSKVLGIILLIYGIMLFVGAYMGSTNPLDPLEKVKTPAFVPVGANEKTAVALKNNFTVVKNLKELENIVNSSSKPVMVDFSAKWCVSCKELEEKTFKDPRVMALFKNFTLVRADVTDNTKEQKAMMKRYNVFGPPVMIFFDKHHNILNDKKLVGYINADDFVKHLNKILQ